MSDTTRPMSSHKALTITPAALNEIERLMARETDKNLFLRIGVAPGGCSGMSYSLAFDTERSEHDCEYNYEGLTVVIDNRALPYLNAATLDYKGGLLGGGFHFENPNAQRSCGCGGSFTC